MPTGRTFLNGFDTNGDKWSAAYIKTRGGYRYTVSRNDQRVTTYSNYSDAAEQFEKAVTKPSPIN